VGHGEEADEGLDDLAGLRGLQQGERALGEVEEEQCRLHIFGPRRRQPRVDELGTRSGERGAALTQHVGARLLAALPHLGAGVVREL